MLGDVNGFPFRVFAPINSGKGHVRGFEAQVNTFFDFMGGPDWLKWFGVQANATYLKHGAKFPRPFSEATGICGPGNASDCTRLLNDPSSEITRPLLNVSKWSYNLIGMFERGPASVRLAYNKRSSYEDTWREAADFSSCCLAITSGPAAGGFIVQPYVIRHRIHEPGRLDLSASYTLHGSLHRVRRLDQRPVEAAEDRSHPHGSDGRGVRSEHQRHHQIRATVRAIPNASFLWAFASAWVAKGAPLAPPPAYVPPPAPPPVAAPAPEPVPPPPPPPPPPTERGERGS